ncbi:hypothetical protein IV102_10280 [bacterium]|nr:hypothetical protein [bacterium]
MKILTSPPYSRLAQPPAPRPQKPEPPPDPGRGRNEMLGAAIGGLALAVPSVKLGFAAAQVYGPEIGNSITRRGLTMLSEGSLSPTHAVRAIQWATDPMVQARVGGLAIGTLGILVGAGIGYLAVRSFTPS